MNRPDFCAKLIGQIGRRRRAPALPRRGPGDGAGHPDRSPSREYFADAEKSLGDRLRVIEQGNIGGSGGYRPRPVRVGAKGTADVRVVHGRRHRLRARGHHPGRHLRRPGQAPDHRRRPHVQPLLALAAAQLRRDRAPVAVLVDDPAGRLQPTGTSRPATCVRPRWLHKRVDVDFNGWFMCLIPREVLERDRAVPAAVHQVGRLRVRAARQGGRLPDGHLARCRRLARAVDRQERRARLAGLLPPPQPVRRGAAALAVPARRPDDPGEPQPPDQAPGLDAVLHRGAAPPGAR